MMGDMTEATDADAISSTESPVCMATPDDGVPEKAVTKEDSCSKTTKTQPVEQQLTNSNAYHPPAWAAPCPPKLGYRLEVIKNGIPLPEAAVSLNGDSSCEEDNTSSQPISYCLFGRQPQQYLRVTSDDALLRGQCATLAHPSISRLHAVLQYGRPPPAIARLSTTASEFPEGWYIQDLESTHGTLVNKRRLPPGRFVRVHVGHVIRFGGSTRLHLLQGPPEDVEQESSLTWTELKQAYLERKNAPDKVDSSRTGNPAESGCDWGISADDANTDSAHFLASMDSAACLTHEHLYREDPKRALLAYFEREGIDPAPEFEFVEAGFGKQHCKIELPLATGTVIAEATTGGKRKEAIAMCALEACQILDRLGEFDPNKNSAASRKKTRTREYWEENAYYSSDEDTFIDRTGQVERKRLERIRQLGVQGPEAEEAERLAAEKAQKQQQQSDVPSLDKVTMFSVLAELEKIGNEIVTLEERLEQIDKEFMPNKPNPSELDELEAYMAALKSGAPSRKERQQLKSRLFALRQTEMRLFHKAGLPQPVRAKSSDDRRFRLDAAAAVRVAKRKLDEVADEADAVPVVESRSKNARLLRNEIKRSLSSHADKRPGNQQPRVTSPTDDFEVEEDDEDADDEELSPVVKPLSTPDPTPLPSEPNQLAEPTSPEVKEEKPPAQPTTCPSPARPVASQLEESIHTVTAPVDLKSPIPVEQEATDQSPVCQSHDEEPVLSSPPPPTSHSPEVKPVKRKAKPMPYDPDYVTWMPPTDQSGDGTTALNAKYGY